MVVLGMKQKDTRQQYMQDMQDVQQLHAAVACSISTTQKHNVYNILQ